MGNWASIPNSGPQCKSTFTMSCISVSAPNFLENWSALKFQTLKPPLSIMTSPSHLKMRGNGVQCRQHYEFISRAAWGGIDHAYNLTNLTLRSAEALTFLLSSVFHLVFFRGLVLYDFMVGKISLWECRLFTRPCGWADLPPGPIKL